MEINDIGGLLSLVDDLKHIDHEELTHTEKKLVKWANSLGEVSKKRFCLSWKGILMTEKYNGYANEHTYNMTLALDNDSKLYELIVKPCVCNNWTVQYLRNNVLAASHIIKRDWPDLDIRVVNWLEVHAHINIDK